MGSSPERAPWWDREVDESGSLIRADVREAARQIWGRVCVIVRRVLGDSSEAQELLEKAVQSVSRYLDRNKVPPHDPSGLLVVGSSISSPPCTPTAPSGGCRWHWRPRRNPQGTGLERGGGSAPLSRTTPSWPERTEPRHIAPQDRRLRMERNW